MNSRQRRFARRHNLINKFEAGRRLDVALARTMDWIDRFDAFRVAKRSFENTVMTLLGVTMVVAWWNFAK